MYPQKQQMQQKINKKSATFKVPVNAGHTKYIVYSLTCNAHTMKNIFKIYNTFAQ